MYEHTTLVKFGRNENCISIQTTSREHGKTRRFLIVKEMLTEFVNGDEYNFIDKDCGDFIVIVKNGITKTFEFEHTHLSDYCSGKVQGYRERYGVPMNVLENFVNGTSEELRYLATDEERQPKIVVSASATESIRKLRKDKLTARAFSKGMRDFFRHMYGTIQLYRDGNKDFYFRESPFNSDGGLILHKTNVEGCDGKTYQKLHYSKHT